MPPTVATATTPATPADLAAHNCLVMRFSGSPDRHWPFSFDGSVRRVTVRGDRTSNDSELIRHWCEAGHGVALKSDAEVARHLESGRLVALLQDYEAPPWPVQLVFPGDRPPSRRLRYVIERLVAAGLPDGHGPAARPI